jgi:hypothetical protein
VNPRLKKFKALSSVLKSIRLVSCAIAFLLLNLSNCSYSQNTDSTKHIYNFGSNVMVTNNGISFIPTFSLGKPAVIFDMSVGRKLSFEPQFRFALEGKPWSFLFWWRYKLIKSHKVFVGLGAHPALSFKTITVTTTEGTQDIIRAQRYLAGELSPNYFITKNISVGMYYLYSRCLEEESIRNTNFLTLNANFSNIPLAGKFYMKFAPQLYYLKMDNQDGFYFTSALTLANRRVPISISTIVNKVIQTEITTSKDFVWNINLIYTFKKSYVKI